MTLNEIESQLVNMDKWFTMFLNKFDSCSYKKTPSLWKEYHTELDKYIELKQEYRLLQLRG